MKADGSTVLSRAAHFYVQSNRKAKMSKYYKRGRDAKTGRFIPVKEAERRKSTAIVERVKKK